MSDKNENSLTTLISTITDKENEELSRLYFKGKENTIPLILALKNEDIPLYIPGSDKKPVANTFQKQLQDYTIQTMFALHKKDLKQAHDPSSKTLELLEQNNKMNAEQGATIFSCNFYKILYYSTNNMFSDCGKLHKM